MPGSFGRTEQEERIESLYKELDDDFKKVAKAKDSAKVTALLKDITNKLKDAKTCAQAVLKPVFSAPGPSAQAWGCASHQPGAACDGACRSMPPCPCRPPLQAHQGL